MAHPRPARTRRKLILRALAALTAGLILLIAAAPWLLGTGPARRLVLGQLNARLAPAGVELAALRLSWFGPIRLDGLALRSKGGRTLLAARSAELDRGLLRLLTDRPHYGTLTVVGAQVDIERRADGSIDLLDALDPLIGGDSSEPSHGSATDLTVKVVDARVRLASPELPSPFVAERVDGEVRVPPTPAPLSCDLALKNSSAGAESLSLKARLDHRKAGGDLAVEVRGGRWPFAVDVAGVAGRVRLDGMLKAERKGGHWTTSGDARLLDLDATGHALAGDRLQLALVEAHWDAAEGEGRRSIRRLDVKSPLGDLSARGELATLDDATAHLDGRLDLAALARQLPHTLRLREGVAVQQGAITVRADLKRGEEGQEGTAEIGLGELAGTVGGRPIAWHDPATVSAHVLRNEVGTIKVEHVVARTAFLEAEGTGDLEKGVKLTARLDLAALRDRVGTLIDLGDLDLDGRATLAASFQGKGSQYQGDLTLDADGLAVAGLTAEPLRSPKFHLKADARGPADPTGVPTGWAGGALVVQSSLLVVDAKASPVDGGLDLLASVATVLPPDVAGRAGQVAARLAGRLRGRVLEADELRIELRPGEANQRAATLATAVKGRLDLHAGTLALEPLAGGRAVSLAPGEGGLRVSGWKDGAAALKVEGQLKGDLATLDRALAYWTSAEPYGLAGGLGLQLAASREPAGAIRFGVQATSQDLSLAGTAGPRTLGPLSVASNGTYGLDADRLDLADFGLTCSFGAVKAAGRLDGVRSRRVADLSGTLGPNWAAVGMYAATAIEPGAKIQGGEPRPFRIRGPLSGDSVAAILGGLDAELGVNLAGVEAFGVRVGPAPVVVRCGGGQMVIDPIATTINGGRLDLKPQVALDPNGGMTLVLAPGPAIEGATIDDEVSTRVLSYIAPILHQATQVSGRLSLALERAELPLVAPDGRTTTVVGSLTFDDVSYGPGPLATELLTVAGEGRVPGLRLNQTVPFWVAQGKVGQKGLTVPVNDRVQIVMDGAVGFDHSIALRAAVPITAAMLGNERLAGQIVGGTTVGVPIGGTLSHPAIDRQAMQVALRETTRGLIRRGAEAGVGELLRKIEGPQAGNAPPAGGGNRPPEAGGLVEEGLRLLQPRRGGNPRQR